MTGNLRKREQICKKADMSRKSSLTISQTVLSFVMYLEKLSRKPESEKIRTLCGFAWILLMEIYLPENVAVLPVMERAANMYLLWETIRPVPLIHNNGGEREVSEKKIHQPDKTKNMKVKKTRAGLQISEEAGRLNRSVFDPRAPGDRFSSFKSED